MAAGAVVPPPPPGFKLDKTAAPPPPPPGFKLDTPAQPTPKPTAEITPPRSDQQGLTGMLGHAEQIVRTKAEGGTTPAVANFMASPELGVLQAAKGVSEYFTGHPVAGMKDEAKGALEAATIPGMVMGPEAVNLAPSAERASAIFDAVKAEAGNMPVNLKRAGDELLRMKELDLAGGKMPKAVTRLLERYTAPVKTGVKGVKEPARPLTYSEARDFYQNITQLSADEGQALKPVVRRQMAKVARALKDDIGDAAREAGQAAQYYQAMGEYAKAKQLAGVVKTIAKTAIGASVLGEGWNLYQKVLGAK